MATEDLKDEILELKKRLHTVTSENYLLKVKVRKLQNELDKKDKQMECILDPSKTTCIRKIISERGATMIINLKQHNNELEEALVAKDNIIKKLHLDILTSKVYLPKESPSHIKNVENKHIPLKYRECNHGSSKINNKLRSRSLTVTPVPQQSYLKSSSDIQMECVRLAQNLQKIKLANSASTKRHASHNVDTENFKSTVENVLAKSSVEKSTTPAYNGGQNVEKCFTNLLEDMEKLKNTVNNLSTEQENTKKILKDKNRNIEILARKVKYLQKSKFTKTSPNKSQNIANLKLLENIQSEGQDTSTSFTYSQESFEDESSNEVSPKKSSITTSNEQKDNTESYIEISENIERVSDDDDVETGDSK